LHTKYSAHLLIIVYITIMIDDRDREFFITALAICYINLSLLVGLAIWQWDGQPKNRGLIPGKGKKNVYFPKYPHRLWNSSSLQFTVYQDKGGHSIPPSSEIKYVCGAVSPLPNTPSFGEQVQLYIFHFTFSPTHSLQCFVLHCLTSPPETNFYMAFRFST